MVLTGGAVGALMRYIVSVAILERLGGRFPFGTLVINVTGSYLIGLLMPLLTGRLQVSPLWRLLLVTGFLGGYTTFSSFEWETIQAVRSSERWFAFLNVTGSIVLGYLAVWLGVLSADLVRK